MKKILILRSKDSINLGAELITNGDFSDGSTGWIELLGASVSGGKGIIDGTSSNALLGQDILEHNKQYRVQFEVSNFNGIGTQNKLIDNSGTNYQIINSNGSYEFNITFDEPSGDGRFFFRSDTGGYYEVDNVSVREIIPNLGAELVTNGDFSNGLTGWSTTGGWSDGGGFADLDGTNPSTALLAQNGILTIGVTYRVTYDLTISSGSIRARCGFSGQGTVRTISGTYEEEITCSGNTNFDFLAASNTTAEIDNVSVREIIPNLGENIADTGTISNNAGGVMVFTSTGIDAESDGTAINLRPRLLWNDLDIGAEYVLEITNAVSTGATEVLHIYDGASYLVGTGTGGGGTFENLYLRFTAQSTNVFFAFDGREIFTADCDLSLRKVL